jgi:predicted MFS family arabinose efflux permease
MSTRGKRARPAPDMGTPASRARYRDVLGAGEFRMIFVAHVVSMLGNVVAAVALTVLVYQQTGSPALAASVLALSFLPYLLGGVLFGAAADCLPVRRVLVGCDLASAILVACMVVPGVPVPGLLALLFANGLLAPVYQGVRSAVLPRILPPGPRYVLARSLMRMVAQSAQIVGYGVGGLLLAILSPRAALAADALSFAASGVMLRFGTARRPADAGRRGSMARDSLTGLRATLAQRPVRRVLLFSWLVPACAVAPEALAAPYAVHIGQPPRAAGLLLMGIPAGTVVADVLAARLLPSRLQRSIVVPAGLVVFAPLAAFAASPGLGLALVLLVISGLGSAWAAGIDGLLIDAAPQALRNRALALGSAGLMFTQGLGFAVWGIAAQYAPVSAVIPLAAAAGALAVGTLRPDRPRRPRISGRPEGRDVHDAGASRQGHDPGRRRAAGGAGDQAAGAELRGPCRS